MYQREDPARSGGRSGRRRRRRSRLPLCTFLLAVLSFALAFTLPPEPEKDPQPPQAAAVRPIAAVSAPEPPLPPEPDAPDKSQWNLILANPWTPLDQTCTFTPQKLTNGLVVDQRCYPDLQAMMDACRGAGLSPVICSAYRSYARQEELYQNKVARLLAQGRSAEDAETEAARTVALPGTSEHQTGLAVDIVDMNNQNLDESQEDTAVQKWLMEHSWEYGFILRYPSGRSDLTGIIYEPWHYRYVGREAAAEIHEQGVCLEEYLAP